MPSFNPDVNTIAQADADLRPLFDATPIALYGDGTITIYDYLQEENEGYPFVTFSLGPEATNGAATVFINCHVSAYNVPGGMELAAEFRRVVRGIIDDTSHAMRYIRSSRAVNMEGHLTVQVEGRYPSWR